MIFITSPTNHPVHQSTSPMVNQSTGQPLFLSIFADMEVLPTTNFQPDILVYGWRFGEPVVVLTGLLVMLISFYSWNRLGKVVQQDDSLKLSRIFFLLMGISTFMGSIVGHCFLYCLPFVFKSPGWLISMIAVSAFEQASIVRAGLFLGVGWSRVLSWLNIIELTLAMWFVTATLWFPGVEIHSAFGLLLIVTPLEIWMFIRKKQPGSRYILIGVLFLLGGVLIHILKFSLGIWFTYFDIGHVLMCVAFWFFMLGAESKQPESDLVAIGKF